MDMYWKRFKDDIYMYMMYIHLQTMEDQILLLLVFSSHKTSMDDAFAIFMHLTYLDSKAGGC